MDLFLFAIPLLCPSTFFHSHLQDYGHFMLRFSTCGLSKFQLQMVPFISSFSLSFPGLLTWFHLFLSISNSVVAVTLPCFLSLSCSPSVYHFHCLLQNIKSHKHTQNRPHYTWMHKCTRQNRRCQRFRNDTQKLKFFPVIRMKLLQVSNLTEVFNWTNKKVILSFN